MSRKRPRQWGNRRPRRPDPSRRRRRSGSPASFRRPREDLDPDIKTVPRGGEEQSSAMRVVATVVPTVGREGRSEGASAAAGAAGKKSENILQQWKMSDIFDGDFFFKRKNGEILKLKSKKNENWTRERSDTDFKCKNILCTL
jgi:hypothetical protein